MATFAAAPVSLILHLKEVTESMHNKWHFKRNGHLNVGYRPILDAFKAFASGNEECDGLSTDLEVGGSIWVEWMFLPILCHIQVVYLTFKRLWNLAREAFAPVWSQSEVFISKNLLIKSLQKIWSESTQKRRPRGSSIEHGEIWPAKFGQVCSPQIFQVYLLHLSEL